MNCCHVREGRDYVFDETLKKRYNAFWQQDAFERCVFFAEVCHDQPEEVSLAEEQIVRKWTDLEYRLSAEKKRIQNTSYYGDGFPNVFTNFGPGCLAACVGGDFIPAEHTVWFDRTPIIKDWTNPPEIRLDMQAYMWHLIDNFTKMLLKDSNGEYITSVTDIGGNLDIIASLRGTEALLYDLYDYPEEVAAMQKTLQSIWTKAFHYYCDLLLQHQDGMTSWMPIWCQERYFPLQSDFSAMISPDMFEEWTLPELRVQTENMEHSVYHLDGPGQIPHLDMLLSLPRLDAIQWVPGSGRNGVLHEEWYEMYEKIQAAGKGLVLMAYGADGMEEFLRTVQKTKGLHTKGLYIYCQTQDGKQAQELVRLAETVGVK